jgi:hypothetical protein
VRWYNEIFFPEGASRGLLKKPGGAGAKSKHQLNVAAVDRDQS